MATREAVIDDQRQYWEGPGSEKDFTTPFNLELFTRFVDRQARILDFGCGYGRTMVQLAEAGYANVTGIDFSSALIERGKQENPALDLAAYPGGPLPYADDSFDAATMLAVFTCMPKTSQQAEALLELQRVLRPGGLLYVNDFLINRDRRNLDRYRRGQERHGIYGIFELDDGAVLRHHDINHMKSLFSGFVTEVFEETVFETMHGHTSQGFCAMLRMP